MILTVNKTNFQQEVLEASEPVLVHFWTPWCGLCKLIDPILKNLQVDKAEPEIALPHTDTDTSSLCSDRWSIKLVSINADENFKLANYYRLRNLPTIMLFHQGKILQKLDNFGSREQLHFALEEIINNTLSIF